MRCKEQTITFYPDIHSEKTMTEVFPETRLAFETSGSTAVATAAANFAIEDGKSYIVEFDDVLHEIVAASGALVNDLFRVTVADGVMAVSIEQAGSHTVRVITCTTHVCKMPEEYLPEGSGGGDASMAELKANGQIGYTETQEVEAIPEQTIEVAMNEDLGAPVAIVAPAYDFTGVSKVRVLFDGVEYICAPVEGNFGNQVFGGGEDTGEPFFYCYADSEDRAAAGFFIAAEGTHTVSVTAISELVQPMSAKYLPVVKLTTAISSGDTQKLDLSETEHAELYAAVRAGSPVAIRLRFDGCAHSDFTAIFELTGNDGNVFNLRYGSASFNNSTTNGQLTLSIDTIFCLIFVSSSEAYLTFNDFSATVPVAAS